MGVEPTTTGWKPVILPLNYIRVFCLDGSPVKTTNRKADDGSRTHDDRVETCNFTIKLHPRVSEWPRQTTPFYISPFSSRSKESSWLCLCIWPFTPLHFRAGLNGHVLSVATSSTFTPLHFRAGLNVWLLQRMLSMTFTPLHFRAGLNGYRVFRFMCKPLHLSIFEQV